VLIEWLAREGGIVLSWWLLVTLAGAAALPLSFRLLGGLPDRGYTLARAAGMLLVGFVYWLLAVLGFLLNTTGGMLLAWLIVLAIGLIAYWTGPRVDMRAWWHENRKAVLTGEVLFFALLLGWAIVRAHQNGLLATEKPMELAFISATMRSEMFPPNDPWMAGYAISYYYFGYVMAAMLAMLSGIPSTIAFNMMIALLFALTGLTAFGVAYNMVRSRALLRLSYQSDDEPRVSRHRPALLSGLLATVFVALLGNFQFALIELPYQTGTAAPEYLSFWNQHLRSEPRAFADPSFERWEFWWFFRAARVVNDVNFDGSRDEVITEFPQFSFLLADNHPHVLALPFAVLSLGLALNIVLAGRAPNRSETVFYAVVLGGLIFLNTWDGPIYMIALVGAEGLRRLLHGGTGRLAPPDVFSMIRFGLALLFLSVLFYLPFLLSFRSQLGGILPNLLHPTWFRQYFIMFGPLLLILAPFLIIEARRAGPAMDWRLGIQTALILLWALLLVVLLLVVIGLLVPGLRGPALNFVEANGGFGVVLPQLLGRRVERIVTTLFLLAGIALIVGRLFPRRRPLDEDLPADAGERHVVNYAPATGFALLLVGMGVVLTLVPEFVYLRDNFGTRMNTVFKFYYQAWAAFSIAAAYAVYAVLDDEKSRIPVPAVKIAFGAVTSVGIALGLLYPAFGIPYRTLVETGYFNREDPPFLTLDGGPGSVNPDDYAAVMCFGQMVQGDRVIVVERVGGSYDVGSPPTGLTGRLVGIPNLFNWEGHQRQWRGATYSQAAGTRVEDIDRLYADPTWSATQAIIDRYGIDYVFFGTAERDRYGSAAELKFRDRFTPVCEFGGSRYYRVSQTPRGGH
jgi:YYY domain-containing protein